MKPLVSILVPVYNASQWLRQCLDSIVGQSYKNLQVVLVDDGSTDDSLAICREYAERYSFVEVHHQENRGVAAARNALLDKATGDFVLFVDSDDWIETNAIEMMVRCSNEHSAKMVVCGNCIVDECNVVCANVFGGEEQLWDKNRTIREFLRHTTLRGQLWNKLIKRELFEGKQFNHSVRYGEDAAMLWDVLCDVDKVVLINIPLYNYRILSTSISGQRFNSKKMSALNVWRKICGDVEVHYPQ